MATCRYESFAGFNLQVYENRLRDRGTIVRTCYSPGGVVTFTTETGDYTFYFEGNKPMKQLSDGRWKVLGDFGRWAYVKPSKGETR